MKFIMQNKFFWVVPLVVFALPVLPQPIRVPEYWVTLLNYIGLYSIVAIGLVLLTGIGGMTSFGQAAFVGVGAYATAYLTTQYGVSPWLALIAGVVLTALIALMLGAGDDAAVRALPAARARSPGGWRCSSCSAISKFSASTTASTAFRC